MTDVTRPIGYLPARPFQGDPKRIGWRFWIGPLLVARTPGIRPGISIGWTTR